MRKHVIQLQKSKHKNHLSLLSLTPCIQFISNSGGASLPKLFFILVVSASLVQATISLCLDGCNHPCLYTCPPVFATQQSWCHQMSGTSHQFSAQKPYTCSPVFQRQCPCNSRQLWVPTWPLQCHSRFLHLLAFSLNHRPPAPAKSPAGTLLHLDLCTGCSPFLKCVSETSRAHNFEVRKGKGPPW